jgi:hypothetical protein
MDRCSFSLAELLDLSKSIHLPSPCEPVLEEIEESYKLAMNVDMRASDGKTLDAYLKELKNIVRPLSKDGDNTMATIFILDSLGPLAEKSILRTKKKLQVV